MSFKANRGIIVRLLAFTLVAALVLVSMMTTSMAVDAGFMLAGTEQSGGFDLSEKDSLDVEEDQSPENIRMTPGEFSQTPVWYEAFDGLAEANSAASGGTLLLTVQLSNQVTIRFNLMGSGDPKPADRVAAVGEPYGELPDYTVFTRQNYVPMGWYIYGISGDVENITSDSIVTLDTDHVVYLGWGVGICSVTFYPGDGAWDSGQSPREPRTEYIERGGRVTVPGTVIRPGWVFDGWQKPDGSPFDPETASITGNIELTPRWRREVAVSFDLGGGKGATPAGITVIHQNTYGALPGYAGVIKTGYSAGGWYLNADGTGDRITESSVVSTEQDHVLYLKWEKSGYTVTVSPDGGAWADGDNPYDSRYVDMDKGGVIGIPGAVTRPGWEQEGWKDESGAQFIPDVTPVNGDITITPVWRKIVKVRFDLGGGEGVPPAASEALHGKNYGYRQPLPDYSGYTKAGYEALGWYLNAEGTGQRVTSESLVGTDKDHVLYLRWDKIELMESKYTVTVDPYGGMWSDGFSPYATRRVDVGFGGVIQLPGEVVRQGHELQGWTDEKGDPFVPGNTPVTGDITIRAVWKKIHAVTLVPNGGVWAGSTTDNLTREVPDGDILSIPVIERTGYRLLGWTVQGTGAQWETSERVTDDLVLRANWHRLIAVTFDAQGGKIAYGGDPAPIYAEYGSKYGELPYVQKEGQGFTGWYDRNGKKVESSTQIGVNEDHVLTARWSYDKVTVRFNWMNKSNAGSSSHTVRTMTANYGRRFGSLSPAVPEHTSAEMNFQGWYTSPTGGYEVSEDEILTEDITVYAHWTKGKYTVRFVVEGADYLTVTRNSGETLAQPEVPSTAGRPAITGWVFGERKWDFQTDKVKSNMVLVAVFTGGEAGVSGIKLENNPRIEFAVNDKWPAMRDNSLAWDNLIREHLGARVTDATGKDITDAAVFHQLNYGSVNFNAPGEYTVTFTASVNTAGGVRTLTGSTVIAIVDRTGPVIEVQRQRIGVEKGSAPSEGEILAAAGVSVMDNCDAQVMVEVAFEGISFNSIDWNRENEYVIRLNAVDSSGNRADRRKILVIEVAGQGGSISGNASGSINGNRSGGNINASGTSTGGAAAHTLTLAGILFGGSLAVWRRKKQKRRQAEL